MKRLAWMRGRPSLAASILALWLQFSSTAGLASGSSADSASERGRLQDLVHEMTSEVGDEASLHELQQESFRAGPGVAVSDTSDAGVQEGVASPSSSTVRVAGPASEAHSEEVRAAPAELPVEVSAEAEDGNDYSELLATRLASAQKENVHLRQLLAREDDYEGKLMAKLRQVGHQAKEAVMLRREVDQLSSVAQQNKKLREQLSVANKSKALLEQSLHQAKAQLDGEKAELKGARDEVLTLHTRQLEDQTKLQAALDHGHREDEDLVAAKASGEAAQEQLVELRLQLNASQGDERKLLASLDSLRAKLRATAANATQEAIEVKHVTDEEAKLRKNVVLLRRRIGEDNKVNHRLRAEEQRAEEKLASAEAEAEQLRGSVPWLEAKIASEGSELKTAERKAALAEEARKAARALLTEERRKSVKLQQQYANAIQALGHKFGDGASGSGGEEATAGTAQTKPSPHSGATMPKAPPEKLASDSAGLAALLDKD
mmetsp:Transcript_36957/g.81132  ORF Transcript_36957/g.81132 Transcript_36957/m.81132 type:complete len:490 (+) Transcript_36957:94-1563(+)|eukprot:CAMPEP_0170602952 /NCGR_PEP_ID=MMETSP0224-20130122/18662_1 /TAXON_ID=285029 /ORGANISM="Togula jolla, Strain CCCM 725" /LENGTH=489 /DNA_ID=CAMNT_0010927819 /DNA_START=20 /DNA_END=1486 /DNA_ORIENTATION=-